MRRLPAALVFVAMAAAFPLVLEGSRAEGFTYDVPVQAKSPWPEMRRDSRNTASSPVRGRYLGGRPWAFATKRGIFSTPVIGGDDTIYVGSADRNFYALRPDGTLAWRFRTGGIIDAAGAIGRYVKALRSAPVTIGSGDERLYRLRTNRHLSRKQRIVWAFAPTLPPVGGQQVSWWEGNVAIGPGGTIYAGNTGGAAYAINPDGTLRWAAPRGQSVWTTPAFGQGTEAGNTFWGSVDLYAFSLDQAGHPRWQTFTPGYVTSSPALGSDGTVYVGSFDHKLYALDPDTGKVRWSFATDAHIYSSPALADGPDGRTREIYIASADGSVYALDPSGHLLWRYDTGDPIRSSPVLGRKPPRRRPHPLRGLLQRKALRTRCGERQAPMVLRHDSEESRAPRPQRSERLAGAGPTRRLHRRRARPGLVRSLRLLPAQQGPTLQPQARPGLRQEPGSDVLRHSRWHHRRLSQEARDPSGHRDRDATDRAQGWIDGGRRAAAGRPLRHSW